MVFWAIFFFDELQLLPFSFCRILLLSFPLTKDPKSSLFFTSSHSEGELKWNFILPPLGFPPKRKGFTVILELHWPDTKINLSEIMQRFEALWDIWAILHVLQQMWVYFTCPDNGQLYLRIVFSAVTYRDLSSWGRSNISQTSELLELQLFGGLLEKKPQTFIVQFSPCKVNLNMVVKIFPGVLRLCARDKSGWWLRKERHFCIAMD